MSPPSVQQLEKHAKDAFLAGKYQPAIQAISKVIDQENIPEKLVSLLEFRASCHTKLQTYQDALKDASAACRAQPTNLKGYIRAVKVLCLMKDYERAKLVCKKAQKNVKETDPLYETFLKVYANILEKQGTSAPASSSKPSSNATKDNASKHHAATGTSMSKSSTAITPISEMKRDSSLVIQLSDVFKLPLEIVVAIFSLLPLRSVCVSSMVCRKWNEIIRFTRFLWKSADLTPFSRRVTNETIDFFAKRGRDHLVVLKVPGCKRLTNAFPKILQKNGCRSLKTLDITDVGGITAEAIGNMIKILGKQLVELNLTRTRADNQTVALTIANCSRLTSLQLDECHNITAVCFRVLAEKAKQSNAFILETLNLSGCPIDDTTGGDVVKLFPRLKALDLTGCSGVSKTSLYNLAHCTGLKALRASGVNVSKPAEFTLEDVMIKLADGCKGLKLFHLSGSPFLTDFALSCLSISAKLVDVDVRSSSNIFDGAMENLASHCKDLRRIVISGCRGITNKGVSYLVTQCASLEMLDVSNNGSISDEMVKMIAEHGSKIRFLSVADCPGVRSGVGYLVQKVGVPLEYLNMDNCVHVPVETVKNLRRRYPRALISNKINYK
ncbi:Dynein regulatory complex subunit 6 [Quaeritorhiza haematococci]|nr:Dynein regulatory complex subunit 6 [Quaeritorhiza haematococci]